MNENGKIKVIYSWPVIILMCVLFWPVSIYLIHKRIAVDPKVSVATVIINFFTIMCLAIAVLEIGIFIRGEFTPSDIAASVFLVILIVVLRILAKKMRKKVQGDAVNSSTIKKDEAKQTDYRTATTKKVYDEMKEDSQKINLKKVVVKNTITSIKVAPMYFEATPEEPTERVVVCDSCGAKNVVHGAVGKCEYCGTPIQ